MSDGLIWTVIALLAVGTFALRFSFLGLIGNRPLPEWLLRHLRYTAVAVIPGLMAPRVLALDPATGLPDPVLLAAVALTLAIGLSTRNAVWAMLGGAAVLVISVVI